jgi:hypothetical protein
VHSKNRDINIDQVKKLCDVDNSNPIPPRFFPFGKKQMTGGVFGDEKRKAATKDERAIPTRCEICSHVSMTDPSTTKIQLFFVYA